MNKAQLVAFAWARQTYGEVVRQARYQAFRFIEEALELVQAMGLTRDDVERAVNWVFDRPRGDVHIEIGDVRLSIDILAQSQGISSDNDYDGCLDRISKLDPAAARAKDVRKIEAGLI